MNKIREKDMRFSIFELFPGNVYNLIKEIKEKLPQVLDERPWRATLLFGYGSREGFWTNFSVTE